MTHVGHKLTYQNAHLYVEETYPNPREILAEIGDLEQEIAEGLRELGASIDE